MAALRFAGEVALITGAASGIGRATAKRFGAEGASVVCLDFKAEGVKATTKAICDAGGKAIVIVGDVRDPKQCKDAVATAIDTYGKLTILCNIAGILSVKHCADESIETWQDIMATNISGPFYLSQAALPHLLKHRGNIVNIGSTAGLNGHAYMTGYCASKHAIIGLTRSMAVEFGKQGLRINAVCPGGVNTGIAQGQIWPEDLDPALMARLQLSSAIAQPEDMANLICFVASSEASFINGAIMSADSGATAG
jgi:meso-butanediol dehydrogenase / (S,S)-butanediol dehydrogenase / diacetyl reductase